MTRQRGAGLGVRRMVDGQVGLTQARQDGRGMSQRWQI